MAFPLSFRVALISTAVLTLAALLKLSAPLLTDFAASDLPLIYGFIHSWLRPPYLYLLINCIIITIVASSKLQTQQGEEYDQPSLQPELVLPPPPVKISADTERNEYVDGFAESEYRARDLTAEAPKVVAPETDKRVPQRSDSLEFLLQKLEETEKEKPLVSARFRKSTKASLEGGRAAALGVSRPRRHDTLETTWKTITDGRPIPLARHLKKSDTWDSHPTPPPLLPPSKMKKSETFSSQTETKPPKRLTSLKREASLSQDELNRRVEAFINKFNEEMRLQRQESLNQYQEMINRGAY